MSGYTKFLVIILILTGAVLSTVCCGFRGITYERNIDGSIGAAIAGVVLTFVKEDGSMLRTVTTDNNGYYRIALHRGRYWVRAASPLYEDYCSLPGYYVVTGPGYQTGNIFLKKPRVTTLLLIRHAERNNGSLSLAGQARALELIHTLHKAGVTAVYASEYPRTQLTVQPLADILKIETVVYYSEQELVNLILSDHNGDVVLAAGHSNTVSNIMNLFGASGIPLDYSNDFDNLFVVTRRAANNAVQTNVVNLQYGEPSAPDGEKKGSTPLTTFLLVRDLTAGNVASQAGKLAHVAFKLKADMTTLYAAASPETLQPLATALGLPINSYSPANLQPFINQLLVDQAGKMVVIAGENDTLSRIIKILNGSPYPPFFSGEYDNIFIVTVYTGGDARIVNVQYGDSSS
jgi:hypothetical protein